MSNRMILRKGRKYDYGGGIDPNWTPPTQLNFEPTPLTSTGYSQSGASNVGGTNGNTNGGGSSAFSGMLGVGANVLGSLLDTSTNPVTNMVEKQVNTINLQKGIGEFNSIDDILASWGNDKNLDTDAKLEDYLPNGTSSLGTIGNSVLSGVQAGGGSMLASALGGIFGLISGINKSEEELNEAAKNMGKVNQAKRARNRYHRMAYQTAAQTAAAQSARNAFSAAYGGPLGISLSPVGGAVDYMQNEELLDSFRDSMNQFNNKKTSLPKFAFGGALGGYGGDWSNGLNFIKAGGTHGENPIGGVPMGVAQDGMPNLVEEGEVVWNDYVFSNRINVPKETMERLGIKGKDTMTFAVVVEKAQKSSAERPNDPIEKRSLDAVLAGLMQEQEEIRQRKAEREQFDNMEEAAAFAADGGPIHIAKNKKGTFTAAATKHGMGVQEFASHVLANKDKYSPAMVKKANFARNASKWHHALGGHLFWPGGPKGQLITPITDWAYSDYYLGNSPMDAYVPVHTDYSKPWDVWDTQQYFGQDPLVITSKASRPKSNVQPKPFAQSPIKQNPTPIYLPDDSEMNRYVAAINPLATHNLNTTHNIISTNNSSDTSHTNNTGESTEITPSLASYLRYAPILGSAIGLGYNLFNKPDYEYANELEAAAEQYTGRAHHIAPTMLGDYLAYNPFDRLFYANELGAQQAATRRAIMNSSNGNAGQAMAALLAAGYNDNIGLGKLFREGEEYNLGQRQKVSEFNRGTNQFNAEADLKSQMFNAEQDRAIAAMLLGAKERSLAMKQADDQAYQTALMANLSGLFDNIGALGEDYANRYDRNMLINSGVFGTLSQRPQGVSDKDWKAYLRVVGRPYAKGSKTNKRKKGLTI